MNKYRDTYRIAKSGIVTTLVEWLIITNPQLGCMRADMIRLRRMI